MAEDGRVQPGQRMRRVSAEQWNGFVEAARQAAERDLGGQDRALGGYTPCVVLRVSNDTGAALDQFAVVALASPLVEPTAGLELEAFGKPSFSGTAPTATTGSLFGVLQEPLPDGVIGRCCVAGVTWVTVNVTDITHAFAAPTNTVTAKLTSHASAGARIVYKPSGTGDKWCLVRLGDSGGGGGGSLTVAEVDGTPSYTSTVTITVPNGSSIISQPSAGVVAVAAASGTTGGLVILGAQKMGTGTKTFDEIWLDEAGSTNNWKVYGNGNQFFIQQVDSVGAGGNGIMVVDGAFAWSWLTDSNVTLASAGRVMAGTVFAVGNSNSPTDGASATTGGLTFLGGIYTGGTITAGGGAVASFITTTTATGSAETYYLCDTTAAGFNVTLTTGAGRVQHVKNRTGANNVTVIVSSGFVDGAPSATLTPGQAKTYCCNGTNWFSF